MKFVLVRNAVGAPPAGGAGGLSALVGARMTGPGAHSTTAPRNRR